MSKSTPSETKSVLAHMASLNLTGDGYSDYAKARALNVVFKTLQKLRNEESLETAYGAAAKYIADFAYGEPKDKNERIRQFIALFKQLVEIEFHGSISTLLHKRNVIRAAYIWEVSEMLSKKFAKLKEVAK